MGHPCPLFVYLRSFQKIVKSFQQIIVKTFILVSWTGIRTHEFIDQESHVITTRLRLRTVTVCSPRAHKPSSPSPVRTHQWGIFDLPMCRPNERWTLTEMSTWLFPFHPQQQRRPVWPDWAIYWILGNFLKSLVTIKLPKSSTFLGNFCNGVKMYHFSSEIILGNFEDIWRFLSGHTVHE